MKNILLFFFLIFALCSLSAQEAERRNEFAKWKWNSSKYWKSETYLSEPDKRFLDFGNYTVTWDGKQMTLFAVAAISGIAHGMRESYHADPYIFEKRWGVSSTSFFGSDAWKRNYYNNDPEQAHKPEWAGNFGRDVWHTFDEISLIGITAPVTMSAFRAQPKKYRVTNAIACVGVRTFFAFLTYKTLRG